MAIYFPCQLKLSEFESQRVDCFEPCIPFSKCYVAQELFKENRTYPKVCHFTEFEPYVCCNQDLPFLKNYFENLTASERICQKLNPPVQRPVAVGGYETKKDEFPFMAVVGYGDIKNPTYNCGGFLIDRNFVITAAHCATYNNEPPSVVRIGGDPLSDNATKVVPVVKVVSHPDYQSDTNHNDIAVLVLGQPVYATPVCLWTFGELNLEFDSNAISAGYGSTSFGGPFAKRLLKVYMTILSNDVCKKHYGENQIIESQLCVVGKERIYNGTEQVIQDTCQGDSGGPLLLGERVVGIVSYGQVCGSSTPGIYTNISSYINWIESVVWPENKTEDKLILA
ncbi:trypsin-like [Condylostylus longicornis]|uniref:trypsin-like n=1 Tax=Condylostylus longicornis TaxID=2530218 RepID=UPI00244DFB9F|nr:trypsin-like [Condylostylus longicornis]